MMKWPHEGCSRRDVTADQPPTFTVFHLFWLIFIVFCDLMRRSLLWAINIAERERNSGKLRI